MRKVGWGVVAALFLLDAGAWITIAAIAFLFVVVWVLYDKNEEKIAQIEAQNRIIKAVSDREKFGDWRGKKVAFDLNGVKTEGIVNHQRDDILELVYGVPGKGALYTERKISEVTALG